jgi:prepilin-type N-terminal cleavage/methylation domain-containing protein
MTLKSPPICFKGFTLVELILGLAITAIIGLSVYNVFWSSMKLDDRLRRMHDSYMEVLIADQSMARDLENIVTLNLSASYPDRQMFEGHKNGFEFLTATSKGIKHVRYYSGMVDWGRTTKTIIGQRVSHMSSMTFFNSNALPIEFLLREETTLSDWANQNKGEPFVQIIAAGLKKDTFHCQYAPPVKDLNIKSTKAIAFSDNWNKPGLPFAVSCNFAIYDAKQPELNLTFKRDMYLPPVIQDEQQVQSP